MEEVLEEMVLVIEDTGLEINVSKKKIMKFDDKEKVKER